MRWPGRNRYPAGRSSTRIVVDSSRLQRSRVIVRQAMGEIEDPGADLGRGAVGRHVGEADDHGRDRAGRRQVEQHLGHAEDLERVIERRGGVGRAERLVRAQVACEPVRRPAGAPRQGSARPDGRSVPVSVDTGGVAILAGRRRRRPDRHLLKAAREGQRSTREDPVAALHRRMRIGTRRAPSAGQRLRERLRLRVLAFEPGDRGLRVGTVLDALQPAVEEPDHLVELVEVRSGRGRRRQAVDPVAHDRPARCRKALLHPEGRIDVRVHPAADIQDGRLDRVVVGGEGPAPPVRPVVLLAQPLDQPRRRRLEPLQPALAPVRTPERRVGWHRVHRDLADRVLAQLAER